MSSRAFTVPFSFVPTEGPTDAKNDLNTISNAITATCVRAKPSSIVSWGFVPPEDNDSDDVDIINGHPACGVVMGCNDGTLFIFHPELSSKLDLLCPVKMSIDVIEPRPDSSLSDPRLPHPHSRSSSPSSIKSHLSPFQVSRSRVVSGLSIEQVEAPKNYVDFDDEPEKLKGMLKGEGGVKETSLIEGLISTFDKGIVIEKHDPSIPFQPAKSSLKSKDVPKPQFPLESTSQSSKSLTPSASPSPMSPPINNKQESSSPYSLSLRFHAFPPRFGPTRGIAQISLVKRDQYVACLQVNGDLSIFAVSNGHCVSASQNNGETLVPPAGVPDRRALHVAWIWSRLQILEIGERIFILACASFDPLSSRGASVDSDLQDRTGVTLYQLIIEQSKSSILVKVGEWCLEGSVNGVLIHKENNESITLLHIDPSFHIISQSITVVPIPAARLTKRRASANSSIGLPNPFKVLKSLSADPPSAFEDDEEIGRTEVGDKNILGEISLQGPIFGIHTGPAKSGRQLRILVWSDELLLIMQRNGNSVAERLRIPVSDVADMRWTGYDTFTIKFSDRCERHIVSLVEVDDDAVTDEQSMVSNLQIKSTRSTTLPHFEAACLTSAGDVISTQRDKSGSRIIEIILPSLEESVGPSTTVSRTMWTAHDNTLLGDSRVSALLIDGVDSVILGCNHGLIRRTSFANLAKGKIFSASSQVSNISLNGCITSLHRVESDSLQQAFVAGGADDGSFAFWSYKTLQLCSRWTTFITPLAHVIPLEDERTGRLKGSVLCIAQDGTIAVIALDGFQLLYLIPASMSLLSRVCIGEDNLLLTYEDRHARLWDVKTREFWRSMTIDKAEDLLNQSGWVQFSVEDLSSVSNGVFSLPTVLQTFDSAYIALLSIEAILKSARPVFGQEGKTSTESNDRLRVILSMLLTPGIHAGIDGICRDSLHIPSSITSIGYTSSDAISFQLANKSHNIWTWSTEYSASRALGIVACLQALSTISEFTADADNVIAFYATSLARVIGDSYKAPSLSYLARAWFHFSDEFREPVRLLFNAGIARLTDEESAVLAEHWQHYLPCLQPDVEKESITAAIAVFICGSIAVEKYSFLSQSSLTDISKSIAMYLQDDQSIHKVLAIGLCSRGFDVWQQYVDAMEMLRALFFLSTYTKKEAISTLNVGFQARMAILHIASSSTPLFMTTLTMDIMHPRSVQHRKSILQLVAYLIRKRPLVVYPNLPRLVDAVVKSLDPNSANSREVTLDAATEILGHVVQTFPTVDFHMNSQRLAVGTIEGAIIMFDLKTATRLYVLEGHKKRLAACSFSPDGRRLVTVSLDESVVLVWKVGTSLSSFFTPGAPPRQGNSGSEPFKTLGFNVGDIGDMNLAASFSQVRFEWTADRSVRLKIRDVTLTFST